MANPSCTITVAFFDQPVPSFAYFCQDHPPAWHVGTDGTICPSSRERSICFDLDSTPPGGEFLGIRIATNPGEIQNTNQNYLNDPALTHIAVTPASSTDPSITITEGFENPPTRIWYALGVSLGGVPHWDDPRIYNPPGGG